LVKKAIAYIQTKVPDAPCVEFNTPKDTVVAATLMNYVDVKDCKVSEISS
jgi:hypothetical protein